MNSDAVRLADWLRASQFTVAFTGAGMSTESGIPDFRSPGGVWSQVRPIYFDEFLRSPEARIESWRQKEIVGREFSQAQPNAGHRVLAHWETAGWLEGIITQNIDGLHQLAGSQSILELHGTARAIVCLQCGARYDAIPMLDLFRETGVPPSCPACGGLLKSATVSFGQNLPDDVWADAVRWCEQSEVFVVMGSSLVVEPAARLPGQAKRRGAKLVIINRDETPLDDRADLVVNESIGEFLTAVDRCMGDRPTQDQ